MQARLHGFWPTVRRAFLTGWQVNMDPRQQRQRGQRQGRPAGTPAQNRWALLCPLCIPGDSLLHQAAIYCA